jgi:hypothetical protein
MGLIGLDFLIWRLSTFSIAKKLKLEGQGL